MTAAWTVLWVPPQSETTSPSNSLFEDVVEQVVVLAGEDAVDAVVRGHDCARVAVGDGGLERSEVEFAECAFSDDDVVLGVREVVQDVARRTRLVVAREVLGCRDDAL
ncbi:hypothetical protein LT974_07650 [Halobacterium noricense]|nr:hypothetical protein [Halobacterium noricense]UHH26795.1 hypothetical protein LT974_07650 [Halobacterium noricense]